MITEYTDCSVRNENKCNSNLRSSKNYKGIRMLRCSNNFFAHDYARAVIYTRVERRLLTRNAFAFWFSDISPATQTFQKKLHLNFDLPRTGTRHFIIFTTG